MKLYEVIAAYASVNQGKVQVSHEQFRARRFALKPLGDDLYLVMQPTGFKRGEVFGHDGEMPKCLASCLSEVDAFRVPLEDMDREELLEFARGLGLKPHPNTGKEKLLEVIKAREDEPQAQAEPEPKQRSRRR